jgi:hypothetical protein
LLCEADGYRRLYGAALAAKGEAMKKDASEAKKAATRKEGKHLRVPVLPEEEAEIKRLAQSVGLPVASYLRNVGLGYQVTGILDNKRVEELAKVNGDLGRLGGLLKLWLTDDVRTLQYGEAVIRALLSRIDSNQDLIRDVMRQVVTPRTKP